MFTSLFDYKLHIYTFFLLENLLFFFLIVKLFNSNIYISVQDIQHSHDQRSLFYPLSDKALPLLGTRCRALSPLNTAQDPAHEMFLSSHIIECSLDNLSHTFSEADRERIPRTERSLHSCSVGDARLSS